ncbi:hypothetical protein D3C75_737550 [compost metagenome]
MVFEVKLADERQDVESVGGMFHDQRVGLGRSKIRSGIRTLGIWTGVGHIPDVKDSTKRIHVFMPSRMVPLQFRSAARALSQFTVEIHSLFRGNPVFG